MATLRLDPGTTALVAGTYSLVGHFGEPLGFTEWFDKGERLPLVAVDEAVYFALVERSTRKAEAA
jgi:hypothetical protein